MSETDTCRHSLAMYCEQGYGAGADFGFGGFAPIVPWAIRVDQPPSLGGRPSNEYPAHIECDLFKVAPFKNLDWVYSSHLLEDAQDTTQALNLWLDQIKIGGLLILFLPDQPTYLAHCQQTGQPINGAHKHTDFGLQYVKDHLPPGRARVVHEAWPVDYNPYSFELVLERIA